LEEEGRLGIAEVPEKTGRRTKAAHGTSGKRRVERAQADAPFGARLQGTASTHESLPVFRETAS